MFLHSKKLYAVVIMALVVLTAVPTTASNASLLGLSGDDFTRINTAGFGDSANSYSWGMGYFNGDIYVGTNRHHLWSVLQGVEAMGGQMLGTSLDLDSLNIADSPTYPIGTQAWANEMQAESGDTMKAPGQWFTNLEKWRYQIPFNQ